MTSPSSSASSNPSISVTNPSNDPSITGYHPGSFWGTYWSYLQGKLTTDGAETFRNDKDIANSEKDIARCNEWLNTLFTTSPTITFLASEVEKLNGDLSPSTIRVRSCIGRPDPATGKIQRQGGGFNPEFGILLCANYMRNKGHLEDTLAHEMVHAWDHLRWKVEWGDLRHAACSEVRAAALSGECRWSREFFTRQNYKLTQQHQECVRKRAVMSLRMRPDCQDDLTAVKAVNQVFDSCYNDTRPFDEFYR